MICSVTIDLNLFADALGCVDSADRKVFFFRFFTSFGLTHNPAFHSVAKRVVLTKGSWR